MEKFNLKYIKAGMVASIALFFSIVAFDNMIDYQSNWVFIQHIMSMDTVENTNLVKWRAITNPVMQGSAYALIIFWQVCAAVLCWAGSIRISTKNDKRAAYAGLFMAFLLYMVGFIVIAGEWFGAWMSKYNPQMTAGLFLSCIMFVMIFLQGE